VDERLSGRGVRLRTLIDQAGPGYGTAWLTIESLNGFRACVPLADIARTGVVVFEQGGKPLTIEGGGPARLIVPYLPGPAADVPALSRLVISRQCPTELAQGGAPVIPATAKGSSKAGART
jgi:DMSO/TMAO reductase YedYZ molybdopterin-dependent catalytic subunit